MKNKLRFVIAFALMLCIAGIAQVSAQTYVRGYYKQNGTYVQGHYRSDRDNTNHNNYSTAGKVNPYNQNRGSVAKDYSSQATSYGQGQTIYTGPKGGQYYVNSNGNKTYVPKQPSSSRSNPFAASTSNNWFPSK